MARPSAWCGLTIKEVGEIAGQQVVVDKEASLDDWPFLKWAKENGSKVGWGRSNGLCAVE